MSISWTVIEDTIHAWVVAATGLPASRVIWAQQPGPRPLAPWISIRAIALRPIGLDWLQTEHNPFVIPDTVVTFTGNDVNFTAHGLLAGDGPIRFTTTGTLPPGLALNTDYWVTTPITANAFRVASSFPRSINGVSITLGGTGTGVHTLADTATTTRAGAGIKNLSRGVRELVVSLQCFGGAATGATTPLGYLNAVAAVANLPNHRGTFTSAGWAPTCGPVTSIDGVFGSALFEPRALMEARGFVASEVSEVGDFIQFVELESLVTDHTGSVYVPSNPNT